VIEHWRVIDWRLVGGTRGKNDTYVMVLGKPVIENRPTGLVAASGGAISEPQITGWRDLQSVFFAADAPEYSFDEHGKRLPDDAILERHMRAVAAAWSETVEGTEAGS
jgi:hypothetical protein